MAKEDMIATGKKAPAFTLKDNKSESVKLSNFKDQWTVLYFYPKDDTPGCTKEACEFTEDIRSFKKMQAEVVGISPDSPEKHRKFIDKYKLKVRLLSDPEKKVMKKYGAFGKKKMYGKEVEGVIRSTYLIDPKGKVAYSWTGVKAAGHAEKVREKLAELQA
jgi:peroxiredoxin Q/BCP